MWKYLLVFNLVHCLLIPCQASAHDDCQIPTEDNEVSICSYCSDSHAGVRWAIHPSVLNMYPTGPYMLSIRFHCHNNTSNLIEIDQDACFYGLNMPLLTSLPDPSVWRWHILGQRLPEGTVCQFTAEVKNGFYLEISQLSTSCTISGNESMVIPATCPESNDSQSCPCQCSEGFRANQEVVNSLTCKNIDECFEGIHNCINSNDCVDTDGSYCCINDTPPTTPETTEMLSNTASSTEATFTITPTTTVANTISSSTTTAYSSTDDIDECLVGNHTCSKNAVCRNVEGSYVCECVLGFEGNGINCTSVVPVLQVSESRNVIIGISVAGSLAVILILLFVFITGIMVRIRISIAKQQKENHEMDVEVTNGSISGTINNVKLNGSLVKENLSLCGEMDSK